MTRATHRSGLLLVSGAAAAWSLGGLLSRFIQADSWTMIAWRGLFGAAGLAAVMLMSPERNTWRGFVKLGWAGWLFVLQSAAGMMFYLAALRHTTVASVAVIYATTPFLAAGLGWLAMRERPGASALIASAAALVGVAVICTPEAPGVSTLIGGSIVFAAVVLHLAARESLPLGFFRQFIDKRVVVGFVVDENMLADRDARRQVEGAGANGNLIVGEAPPK
jgi:drug/metabolite transporter (DMT)-like permease